MVAPVPIDVLCQICSVRFFSFSNILDEAKPRVMIQLVGRAEVQFRERRPTETKLFSASYVLFVLAKGTMLTMPTQKSFSSDMET